MFIIRKFLEYIVTKPYFSNAHFSVCGYAVKVQQYYYLLLHKPPDKGIRLQGIYKVSIHMLIIIVILHSAISRSCGQVHDPLREKNRQTDRHARTDVQNR